MSKIFALDRVPSCYFNESILSSSSLESLYDVSELFMAKSNLCEPLPLGGYKDVIMNDKESPTGVNHNYRLIRVSENNYKISFRLNWIDKTKVYNPRITNIRWRKKVSDCFDEVNKNSKGPNNEILTFELFDESKGDNFPPLNYIWVDQLSQRANSESWKPEDKMDCPTIFHEVLHLTGLVDEYKETSNGYKRDKKSGKKIFVKSKPDTLAYDCRKIYESDSIMSDQRKLFQDLKNSYLLQINLCKGPTSELRSYYNTLVEDSKKVNVKYPTECPKGLSKIETQDIIPVDEEFKLKFESGNTFMPIEKYINIGPEDVENAVSIFNFKPNTQFKSLLEPRHFNAMIFPGCYKLNRDYYEASLNSYRTSKKNGGKGCLDYSWMR